ncbi:MAG TPA: ATP-binding cassette domain-containing protein [Candidatus Limnocylindrales bacterium]|nr:ATP-binding cassette domain-containing protein [Candidatus Limnocylindrales bacterium]
MGSPPPAAGAEAIVASGLKRAFGATEAVRGVDLSVPRGEIYGFLGPNGAGKTTVVRMLCTLLRPTSGSATVAGFDVVRHPGDVRLRIGAALQEAALDPEQTGIELLRLQARLFGLRTQDSARRIAELTELVDLGSALDRQVKTYSGGMRRRLDLALALVHEPEVLFLDEPTTGLDPVSRREVWAEVRRLNAERGLTVFLTTQYLEEADELAARVGIIADGAIVAEGSSEELKRRVGRDMVVVQLDGDIEAAARLVGGLQDVERVEQLGSELSLAVTDGPAAIPVVAGALADVPGVAVREMALRRPTLDDAFFALTGQAPKAASQPQQSRDAA